MRSANDHALCEHFLFSMELASRHTVSASATPQPGFCEVDGSAAVIHVRGEGRAVLLEPTPFKDGHAAWVFLQGATIDARLVNPRLTRPAPMEPVEMNPRGRPFDVTYIAGDPLRVDIAVGGGVGGYKGPLPDGVPCPPEWCRITWSGEAKHIELSRDDKDSFPIAGSLPFGADPGDSGPPASSLTLVEVHGFTGVLRCGDQSERLDGAYRFTAGPTRALVLRGPDMGARKDIRVDGSAFKIHIDSDTRPEALNLDGGFTPAPVVAVAAVALVAIGGLIFSGSTAIRRRKLRVLRQPTQSGDAARVVNDEPIRIFISSAPEDATHLDRLLKSLRPLVRETRIEMFSARDVQPGQVSADAHSAWLRRADIILLLVSSDFLASDAHHDTELADAQNRSHEARVIPILVRPADVRGWLGSLQILPRNTDAEDAPRAVTTFPDQDVAYQEIVMELRKIVEELLRAEGRTVDQS